MIKGRVRMHTLDGHRDFAAGEAFYSAPGHAPEALKTPVRRLLTDRGVPAGNRAHHVRSRVGVIPKAIREEIGIEPGDEVA